MTMTSDTEAFSTEKPVDLYTESKPVDLDKDCCDLYYKRACVVHVPILLKIPVYVKPIVIEKDPYCCP